MPDYRTCTVLVKLYKYNQALFNKKQKIEYLRHMMGSRFKYNVRSAMETDYLQYYKTYLNMKIAPGLILRNNDKTNLLY